MRETPLEPARQSHGRRAVVFAAAVVLLVVYPGLRWMTNRVEPPDAAVTRVLRTSYAHYQSGLYDKAAEQARAALTIDPESADAYTILAAAYLATKRLDEASMAAGEALRLRPHSAFARHTSTSIDAERRHAASGPVVSPTDAAAARDLLDESLRHAQAERFEQCVEAATRATRFDPASSRAWNNAAFCAARLGRWRDAIRDAEVAVRLDPTFQLARNNLAWMRSEEAASAADTDSEAAGASESVLE